VGDMKEKRILLHVCCAICAIYPVKILREQGWEVVGLFYNPNIHPYLEYCRRLEAVEKFFEGGDLSLIVKDEYEMEEFLRRVSFREARRCFYCYNMRLERTAYIARHGKFHAFTTTLLVSPYQKHELIREVGEDVAKRVGVEFFYHDFRDGFKEAHRQAETLGLYKQQYCGCIYSEYERYKGVRGKDASAR